MKTQNIIIAPGCNRNIGFAEFVYKRIRPIEKSGQYKIIKDYGENFGLTKPSEDNVICIVPHGNRHVWDMKERFAF